ncbi:MAG: hypothetical protein P8Z81_15230 [Deinococcales bacterium]
MSDFFHDPNTDDEGDTFVIHSQDGLTLEISPSCLTVRDRIERGAEPLARVPLNLDRIVGVAAGAQVTAHATHAHVLTVRRDGDGLEVRVSTPHVDLLRHHVPLRLQAPAPEEAQVAAPIQPS